MLRRIDKKPLSVNECWNGRRFKSDKYKAYERELLHRLPFFKVPDGKLKVSLLFGFSSKASDLDNPVKAFIDILQKKLGFDDKNIYEMTLKKVNVKKGEEFIEFDIIPL